MKNHAIAQLFSQMADLLEFQNDNVFRIRAYRRAAQSLETFSGSLEQLSEEKRLSEIQGIGEDLANKIQEFLATGHIKRIEELKQSIPAGVLEMMEVPGVGPKTAKTVADKLKIHSVAALEKAAKAHQISQLPGFQAKKEENILKGIAIFNKGQAHMHLGMALPLAREIESYLKQLPGVSRVSIAGSLRRMKESIGDLDLLAASSNPAKIMQAASQAFFSQRVLASGETKTSLLTQAGVQVDIRSVEAKSFGAALQYFTGSKEHNVKLRELAVRQGLKINEYGVFSLKTGRCLAGREEEDVYKAVGLPWMAPELREDGGEIEAAKAGKLPKLVEPKHIKGDFHIHSNWSDGVDSLEKVAAAADSLGYEYIALCDHSRSLKIAHGMSIERIKQQMQAVKQLNKRLKKCRLLMGSEVDILADGSLDYPDSVLSELDFVVASVHTGFTQSQAQLTRRMIAAMNNPYIALIAHPTGRLMGSRESYAIDLEAVFQAAKETRTALEINAYPQRLDLCDTAARRAGEAGVMLAISTDTHAVEQFHNIQFGLGVARRAWLGPRQVLNTFTLKELQAWIAKKRTKN